MSRALACGPGPLFGRAAWVRAESVPAPVPPAGLAVGGVRFCTEFPPAYEPPGAPRARPAGQDDEVPGGDSGRTAVRAVRRRTARTLAPILYKIGAADCKRAVSAPPHPAPPRRPVAPRANRHRSRGRDLHRHSGQRALPRPECRHFRRPSKYVLRCFLLQGVDLLHGVSHGLGPFRDKLCQMAVCACISALPRFSPA